MNLMKFLFLMFHYHLRNKLLKLLQEELHESETVTLLLCIDRVSTILEQWQLHS